MASARDNLRSIGSSRGTRERGGQTLPSGNLGEDFGHLDRPSGPGGQQTANQGGQSSNQGSPPQGIHRNLERGEEANGEGDAPNDLVDEQEGEARAEQAAGATDQQGLAQH